jgi:tetratricopeptide (TPR) repeat protein
VATGMKFKNIKYQKRNKHAAPVLNSTKKKVGDSGKKLQFPSISRRITERLVFFRPPKLTISLSRQSKLYKFLFITAASIVFVIIVILIIGISYFSVESYQAYGKITQINIQRQKIQGKINFWQSVAQKYDGYKDAYFQMAVLDYALGNFQKAKDENAEALILDPNFGDARKLEVILDKH